MFSGNRVIDARELEGLEPVVMNGQLMGYITQEGQGPIAIANDINNADTQKQYNYSTLQNINYKDIVTENPSFFTNVSDINNINDKGYSNLNLNIGDKLSLVKFTANNIKSELSSQISDLKSSNSKLTKELNEVTKKYDKKWESINLTTKQNKAMGGDPRSGADLANYINTRSDRKEAKKLLEQKNKIEQKLNSNNKKIENKQNSINKLNKILND